jgi:type IV pilus assembly protein PilW
MSRHARGFSLIELMVALALGLIVVLGVAQIFISAQNTYVSQNASANMQEDARFVLSKMTQEIRMVGMFGCLASFTDSTAGNEYTAKSVPPISWDAINSRLTLVTVDIDSGGKPTWTIVSDCVNSATAYPGVRLPLKGELAFPIRRLTYTLRNNQLWMNTGIANDAGQVLVDNVVAFEVTFGVANSATDIPASSYISNPSQSELPRIRSVRLSLTLKDPNNRVRNQTYKAFAALRSQLL